MDVDPWLVGRWMSKTVQTIAPDARIVDAVELMRIHRIRHLPVVESGRLVGIVSDRDVRHAIPIRAGGKKGAELAYGTALLETAVAQVMTPHPRTTEAHAPIREAAEIMCREKIGALPVLADEELVGIISAEDVLWAFVENTSDLEV